MKHSLSLLKSVKLLFLGSLLTIMLPLLNSCGDSSTTNDAASVDSASSMGTADTSAAMMSAPMSDSDTSMMKTDTSTKDVSKDKDKKP